MLKAINGFMEKAPGVSTHGEERISMLWFAGDTAVIAEAERDLKKVLTKMERTLTSYNLKINKKKTKILVAEKRKIGPTLN